MKISIITVTYNSARTIAETLQSVADQDCADIEHIVIDGASEDNTLEIVKRFAHVSKVISEPDRGMYDALNKGLSLASGDYIGVLNSDDTLADDQVIQKLVTAITQEQKDMYYGDVRFVTAHQSTKTIRYYSSKRFHPGRFEWGFMPAHPSCYIKKEIFDQFGGFQIDYTIAADYELLTRFLYKHKITYHYIPMVFVNMLPGGVSNESWRSRLLLNQEIIRACAENGIRTNLAKLSLKYFQKVFEYLGK
jgi:glycosyltransferase involved in cell wall biosynthesis